MSKRLSAALGIYFKIFEKQPRSMESAYIVWSCLLDNTKL